tara:strand:+ start:13418 stop:13624 length:207 start_codon:yes stop_codon:yes gene_type:complete
MQKSVGKIIGKVTSVVLIKGTEIKVDEPVVEPVVETVVEVKTTEAKKEPVKKSKVKKSERNANTKKRV